METSVELKLTPSMLRGYNSVGFPSVEEVDNNKLVRDIERFISFREKIEISEFLADLEENKLTCVVKRTDFIDLFVRLMDHTDVIKPENVFLRKFYDVLELKVWPSLLADESTLPRLKGTPEEIYRWFMDLPKDEEYANILDEVVEVMRRGLELK